MKHIRKPLTNITIYDKIFLTKNKHRRRYIGMRYKILINGGSSALLRDFFVNSTGFTCMSTSGYWTDIRAF